MDKINKLFIICLVFLVITPLISSMPPQFSTGGDIGLQIESPLKEFQRNGKDYTYYAHAFNITDGLVLNNADINCSIHVYNYKGDHIVEEYMLRDSNGWDFERTVPGATFVDNSPHNTLIWCNTSTQNLIEMGGFVEWEFFTNPTGSELTEGQSFLYGFMLLILLSFLGTLIYGGVKLPWQHTKDVNGVTIGVNNKKIWKITCWTLSYFVTLWIVIILKSISEAYLSIGVSSIFSWVHWILLSFAIPTFIVAVILLFIAWVDIRKINKWVEKQANFG